MSPTKVDLKNDKPPPFGHAAKALFGFDEAYVNLNHGSYGSIPLHVTAAANDLATRIERNPDKFMRLEFQAMLDKSREEIAKLIEADADEIVLVPNATHALNTVLRNFEWREGDLLVGASTTYNAVSQTMHYLADRSEAPRPTTHAIDLLFSPPTTHAQLLSTFRAGLKALKAAHPDTPFTDVPPLSPGGGDEEREKDKAGNKIVAVIDSIVSNPGVLLPWKEMVAVCREEGVWSVVDAAHSIGQEPGIDLSATKPDFWLSNCHKWLFAKRSCAVLYVPKRNQEIIKSSMPTSHAYVSPSSPKYKDVGTDFVNQHEWTGTSDLTAFLTVPDAIAFRKWLGGEKAINDYCRQLALDGGARLAELLGTQLMDPNGELTLSMTNVRLPLPIESSPGALYTPALRAQIDTFFRKKLLLEWNAYGAHYFHAGAWWTRCSAQVFNEMSDFEYLAKAFGAVCKEIRDTMLPAEA